MCVLSVLCYISIHAAREGGDVFINQPEAGRLIFQSTPPVKAATLTLRKKITLRKFQSTPPVKAATDTAISIHTARGFQSTPPVKAATRSRLPSHFATKFQSTPPVKAATVRNSCVWDMSLISIHAAREGGDLPAFP